VLRLGDLLLAQYPIGFGYKSVSDDLLDFRSRLS
jgi:hypothetical protein